jgi:3-dehydroquinate dehydratase-2
MSYLGRRQPELYGKTSAAQLDAMLRAHAQRNKYSLTIFYTHSEGEAIERLYRAVDEGVDGLVMNPAAFLFAGYALRDCLRAVPFPSIAGFGIDSYIFGLEAMLGHMTNRRKKA